RLMIAGANFSLLVLLFGCSSGETYIVKPGDTLPQIALNHNIALTDLINANQDRYPSIAVDPENPTPGTELFIPSEGNIGIDEWLMRLTRAASPPITPAPDVPA